MSDGFRDSKWDSANMLPVYNVQSRTLAQPSRALDRLAQSRAQRQHEMVLSRPIQFLVTTDCYRQY